MWNNVTGSQGTWWWFTDDHWYIYLESTFASATDFLPSKIPMKVLYQGASNCRELKIAEFARALKNDESSKILASVYSVSL